MAVSGETGADFQTEADFDFRGERIVADTPFETLLNAEPAKQGQPAEQGQGDEAEVAEHTDPESAPQAAPGSPEETDIHGNHGEVRHTHDLAREDQDRVDAYTRLASVTGGELNTSIIGNEARIAGKGGGNSAKERRARRAARDVTDQIIMQQIVDLDRKIAEMDRRIDHLSDYIARGEVEVGEDGKLTDDEAERALREYEERTGRKIDRNDSQAVLDALHQQNIFMMEQRDQYQAERDRLEAAQERLDAAETPEQREAIVRELDLPDASTVIARSDSEEITREAHEALGSTQTDEHVASEEVASTDDLSFMMGGAAPTVSAATQLDGETPVNSGQGVQMTFSRAVAGETVPPGVGVPEVSQDTEQEVAFEGDGQSSQEFTPV